jgi:glutamyl-tRNA synthetase
MSSTPKHLVIYKAFNWEPPSFAHVGLLQDLQQQKISKRDQGEASLDLRTFQEKGVFPEALINYVALFGWSHQRATEVMGMKELINAVS